MVRVIRRARTQLRGLVRRRLLRAVNDEHVDGTLRRFEPQPELFLDRCEYRRTRARTASCELIFDGPLQGNVEQRVQSRLVDDHDAERPGQSRSELRRRDTRAVDLRG